MKIAFTSNGNGWNENIDIRFGRAKGFFIYDTETGLTNFLDNSECVDAAHGAGTASAKKIVDEKIDVLITGKVGPKADEVLKAGNVQIYTGVGYGTIEEAYKKFNDKKLELHNDL